MAFRRRPTAEFEAAQANTGPQSAVLDSLIGGYNGYTSPDLLSPQFWAASSNVYAGQFGAIRRARWAPFFNSTATGFTANSKRIVSQYSFLDILHSTTWLMFENNDSAATGPRWLLQNPLTAYTSNGTYGSAQVHPLLSVYSIIANSANVLGWPLSLGLLNGPYMRTQLNNIILEANGSYRGKILINGGTALLPASNVPFLENWGIDAPDVSPQIALSSGTTATISTISRSANVASGNTTAPHGLIPGQWVSISGVTDTSFNTASGTQVQLALGTTGTFFAFPQIGANASSSGGTITLGITQTVGRSYAYAWENASTGHVSAPSPASQYVKYASQKGTIDCVEVGTLNAGGLGSGAVVGTGTAFSSAWVGKAIWIESIVGGSAFLGYVLSVTDATHMTITSSGIYSISAGSRFQVIDPQATHVRLYATGDGGAVYFLIARNIIFFTSGLSAASNGYEFPDTANSTPPNAPFSSELSQTFNVPPPIGSFVDQYQGRPIVYGVSATPQTFYYGNMESTVVGQPCESFAPLNTVTLPIGDGQIYGSANLPTGFILWSNRQDMFKMTGLLSDNVVANQFQLGATIQRLPYKIGCASPYATAVTPLGAMWLSADREVWLFTDNYAPKNIGRPIQDILNRINGSRLAFAKLSYFKRGERSWLALAIALDSSTFNNKLCLLDLDLLASNGQPSFFTFDMATNQPTWYLYDLNCEGICTSYDNNSVNHLFVGDVDLITDVDWQTGYYTISAEQSVTGKVRQHAIGNEDPLVVKTMEWMRVLTNQFPKNLSAQAWRWNVYSYDDDKYVIGLADDDGNTTKLNPGVNSNASVLGLEYSPALFRLGALRPVKGRRFQIETIFPSTPGSYELRGFEVQYTNVASR